MLIFIDSMKLFLFVSMKITTYIIINTLITESIDRNKILINSINVNIDTSTKEEKYFDHSTR